VPSDSCFQAPDINNLTYLLTILTSFSVWGSVPGVLHSLRRLIMLSCRTRAGRINAGTVYRAGSWLNHANSRRSTWYVLCIGLLVRRARSE